MERRAKRIRAADSERRAKGIWAADLERRGEERRGGAV